jgi:4-aminobutyrate aminotransferase-like enzyme
MLREICDTYKILLVFDEIYTGFNRTGTLFACEQFGVYPDLVCIGKALTTGFPLSACVGRSEVMDAWPRSKGEALHTTTFLGNPIGCAMALASIDLHLDPEIPSRVASLGRYFRARLENLPGPSIGHVRGLGLMLGVELIKRDGSPDAESARNVVQQGLQEGLLLLAGAPAGNVVSFTPPFCIETPEIDFVCERIQKYLRLGSIS